MSVPAFAALEGLLRFAAAGESEKVARSLELLAPLVSEHERLLGPVGSRAAREALRGGDRGSLEPAARSFVLFDVLVLLRKLDPSVPDRSRTWARTALLEWRLVEASAMARDLRGTQAAAAALRDVVEAVEAGDFGEARSVVRDVERALLPQIEIR